MEFAVGKSPRGAVRVRVRFTYRDAGYDLTIGRLLSDGAGNAKLAKSGPEYKSFGLSLAPAKESGYQCCPRSTPGCRRGCIYTSGYAQVWPKINAYRVAKTRLWFERRGVFEEMLRRDLAWAKRVARREGKKPVVRPDMFTDIPWERQAAWMFGENPEVQFMGYTKVIGRVLGDLPPNYDLTFSRSEANDEEVAEVLGRGGRVAVVFGVPASRWKSHRPKSVTIYGRTYRVVDGDRHDLRFLDPRGVVVGLAAKGRGRLDRTGFVLRPDSRGEFRIGSGRFPVRLTT